ncbi:hypothetical protein A5906_36675 [Bradyrhizobium sacchari]|nr:hypothetical protein A5906_36675 [Bradyrhizobium sacchari]
MGAHGARDCFLTNRADATMPATGIDWRAAQVRWRFLPLRMPFPKSRDICETGERPDRSSHPQTKERSMLTSRLSRRSAVFLLMANK